MKVHANSLLARLKGATLALEESALEAFLASAEDAAPSAMLFSDEDAKPLGYAVLDGVAYVTVRGPLLDHTSAMDRARGFVSSAEIADVFHQIARDEAVDRLVLEMDSPGGMVDGVDVAASALRTLGKPSRTHVLGTMASAGYWIGSSADEIYARPTARVGSIGAVLVMKDGPGEGRTVITSKQSPLKNAPVCTPEGRGVYQQVVDDLAGLFISAVARNRGVKESVVLSDYGQGAIMVASRAQDAGMIDGILGAQMEEQLREAQAQIQALTAERDEATAQLQATATQAQEAVTAQEQLVAERDALTARLSEVSDERNALTASLQEKAEEAKVAKQAAYEAKRATAIKALIDEGRITLGQEGAFTDAYNIQHAEGSTSTIYDSLVATLPAGGAISFDELGSGGAGKAPSEHEQVKALAAENGYSYDEAYEAFSRAGITSSTDTDD